MGASPLPQRGSTSRGRMAIHTMGVFSQLGVGGASDRGAPTRTIRWELPRGTGGMEMRNQGGGTRSPWAGGAVLGSRLLLLAHSRGRRPTEPPCLDSVALGTHLPYKGGWTTSQGHHRQKGPHLRCTLGWRLQLQNWGQEPRNCKIANLHGKRPWTGRHQKLRCFRRPREASKNSKPICSSRREVSIAQSSTPQ